MLSPIFCWLERDKITFGDWHVVRVYLPDLRLLEPIEKWKNIRQNLSQGYIDLLSAHPRNCTLRESHRKIGFCPKSDWRKDQLLEINLWIIYLESNRGSINNFEVEQLIKVMWSPDIKKNNYFHFPRQFFFKIGGINKCWKTIY